MMIIMGIVGVIFAIVVIGKIPDVVNRACQFFSRRMLLRVRN